MKLDVNNFENYTADEYRDNLLRLVAVSGLVCPECKRSNIEIRHKQQSFKCNDCKEGWAN